MELEGHFNRQAWLELVKAMDRCFSFFVDSLEFGRSFTRVRFKDLCLLACNHEQEG